MVPALAKAHNAHKERLARISACGKAEPSTRPPTQRERLKKAFAAGQKILEERARAVQEARDGGQLCERPFSYPAKEIVQQVADKHGLTITELRARRSIPALCQARFEVCHRLREETPLSLPAIGRWINRHHTTVLHACQMYVVSQTDPDYYVYASRRPRVGGKFVRVSEVA